MDYTKICYTLIINAGHIHQYAPLGQLFTVYNKKYQLSVGFIVLHSQQMRVLLQVFAIK